MCIFTISLIFEVVQKMIKFFKNLNLFVFNAFFSLQMENSNKKLDKVIMPQFSSHQFYQTHFETCKMAILLYLFIGDTSLDK